MECPAINLVHIFSKLTWEWLNRNLQKKVGIIGHSINFRERCELFQIGHAKCDASDLNLNIIDAFGKTIRFLFNTKVSFIELFSIGRFKLSLTRFLATCRIKIWGFSVIDFVLKIYGASVSLPKLKFWVWFPPKTLQRVGGCGGSILFNSNFNFDIEQFRKYFLLFRNFKFFTGFSDHVSKFCCVWKSSESVDSQFLFFSPPSDQYFMRRTQT